MQKVKQLKFIFRAFQLWSINLVFPFTLCFVLPFVLKDVTGTSVLIYDLFKFWFVEGILFHIVLYIFCFLTVIKSDSHGGN